MSKTTAHVVLLDDDIVALKTLLASLRLEGLAATLHTATTPATAEELIQAYAPQVVVTDLCLTHRGADSGYEFLQRLKKLSPLPCRVIVMTGYDDTFYGVRALELGASHFISKSPDPHHLKVIIDDAVIQSNILREKRALESELRGSSSLKGDSDLIKKLRDDLAFCAQSNLPMLLLGEPGTGKTLCAKELHRLSPTRHQGRCIKYQPGLTSAEMVASDLFGHARGAFTGAERERVGLIAEAHRGTFFLDEIDVLPLNAQALLLGVLQEKKFRPLGSNEETNLDTRFIGATNKNIHHLLSSGQLREDFIGRLGHMTLELPPLRARREDIVPLAATLLEGLHDREGFLVFELSPEALTKLQSHSWPGNVRELEGVVERAALCAHQAGERCIETNHLLLTAPLLRPQEVPGGDDFIDTVGNYYERVRCFEKSLITRALSQCAGNQSEAARVLKMDRHALRRIVTREGL